MRLLFLAHPEDRGDLEIARRDRCEHGDGKPLAPAAEKDGLPSSRQDEKGQRLSETEGRGDIRCLRAAREPDGVVCTKRRVLQAGHRGGHRHEGSATHALPEDILLGYSIPLQPPQFGDRQRQTGFVSLGKNFRSPSLINIDSSLKDYQFYLPVADWVKIGVEIDDIDLAMIMAMKRFSPTLIEACNPPRCLHHYDEIIF